jgi:glycosyltransferase involved in cell wall biosynthesis
MTISLCLIVKNESGLLTEFLEHYIPLADEIIIIDTGSTDNTVKIAEKFTNKVYNFKWSDDFSSARNFSISKATKDWILWMDPDEMIDEKDFEKIRNLTEETKNLGYRFIQETHYKNKLMFIRGICKLFQNNKGIEFVYPVHETVRESIKKLNGRIGKSGIVIKHNPKLNREKSETYLRLLERKKEEFPKSNFEKEIENENNFLDKL